MVNSIVLLRQRLFKLVVPHMHSRHWLVIRGTVKGRHFTRTECISCNEGPMFAGSWANERGSVMILEQDADRISGRYITRLGHDAVADSDHPVVGFANGTT